MDMPLMQHCPRLTASQQLLLFPGRTRPLRSRFRTWMCHTCHTCCIFPCPTCPVCSVRENGNDWNMVQDSSDSIWHHWIINFSNRLRVMLTMCQFTLCPTWYLLFQRVISSRIRWPGSIWGGNSAVSGFEHLQWALQKNEKNIETNPFIVIFPSFFWGPLGPIFHF